MTKWSLAGIGIHVVATSTQWVKRADEAVRNFRTK